MPLVAFIIPFEVRLLLDEGCQLPTNRVEAAIPGAVQFGRPLGYDQS
jgi:hypothetical protein